MPEIFECKCCNRILNVGYNNLLRIWRSPEAINFEEIIEIKIIFKWIFAKGLIWLTRT